MKTWCKNFTNCHVNWLSTECELWINGKREHKFQHNTILSIHFINSFYIWRTFTLCFIIHFFARVFFMDLMSTRRHKTLTKPNFSFMWVHFQFFFLIFWFLFLYLYFFQFFLCSFPLWLCMYVHIDYIRFFVL